MKPSIQGPLDALAARASALEAAVASDRRTTAATFSGGNGAVGQVIILEFG